MAAIAPLVLADGLTTNRTFDVNTSQEGLNPAIWLEKTAGSYAGFQKASLLVKRTPNGTTTRISLRITCPIIGLDGNLSHQSQFNASFVMPDKGVEAERADILAFAKNMLADAQIIDAVEKLNPSY
jgi:hypothetical protein